MGVGVIVYVPSACIDAPEEVAAFGEAAMVRRDHVGGPPRRRRLIRKTAAACATAKTVASGEGDTIGAYSMLMSLSPAATVAFVVDAILV